MQTFENIFNFADHRRRGLLLTGYSTVYSVLLAGLSYVKGTAIRITGLNAELYGRKRGC